MERRTFVASLAGIGATSIAGCSQLPLGGDSGSGSGSGSTGGESPTETEFGTPEPTYVDIEGVHEEPLTDLLEFYNVYIQADMEKMERHLHDPRMRFPVGWNDDLPEISFDVEVDTLDARFVGDVELTEDDLVTIATETSADQLTESEAREIADTRTRVYRVNPKTGSAASPDTNGESRFLNNVLRKTDWILSYQQDSWRVV